MKKTKMLIAGIGAVGGYFGGLMAGEFQESEEVEICFLARGANLVAIQNEGLTVLKGEKKFLAIPKLATDDAAKIGAVDFLILCTKSYDLEATMQQLSPCITDETVILPLLNGVDSRERIENSFPNNLVLDGCVYILARLTAAGQVENMGNIQDLYFGLDNTEDERLFLLEKLFKKAGVEAFLSKNISTIIWEKFIFIAAIATATSFYDCSIGVLLADEEKLTNFLRLIEEAKELAAAKQISIRTDIRENTLVRMKSLPYKATSSMHSDFQQKKHHTELQSLTAYIVQEAEKYKLPVPTFAAMYELLSSLSIG